jgi:hypothetical protein
MGLFKEVFVELNQQKSFCDECNSEGWVPHPVLYRFFGEKFSSLPEKEQENCIKERWGEFRELLWDRRPQKLMHNGREERLRQIINAQGAEGYIAVCRSVHPEIESLAREYVYRDENFISSLKEAASKSRAKEINTRVNKLFDEDASPLGGAYIIEMGGIMACETMSILLTQTRAEYAPLHEEQGDFSKNRHFHAHGVPYTATHKDGINALLLLDIALQAFAPLTDTE